MGQGIWPNPNWTKPHQKTVQNFGFLSVLVQLLRLILFLCPFALIARPIYQDPWGKDSDLKPHIEKIAPERSIGTRLAEKIIDFHQQVISPVDGPRSHYRPSSSQYMRLAMRNYGFFKGFIMGCDRLLRENDEKWVYHTIEENGQIFKYDPARFDKYGPIY